MMKEIYENSFIKITDFDVEDVITTSAASGPDLEEYEDIPRA